MIELIMVISIIAVIATLVGPKFFQTQPFEERFFYEDTLAAIRYAQKLAVVEGCRVQVTINSGYQLHKDDNCFSPAAANYSVQVSFPADQSAHYQNTDIPPGFVINATPTNFVFAPDGRASADVVINTGSRQILVEGATGYVR